MGIGVAKGCFGKSIQIANTEDDQEKLNLYQGLWHMADAVEDLARKIRDLENKVDYLSSRS